LRAATGAFAGKRSGGGGAAGSLSGRTMVSRARPVAGSMSSSGGSASGMTTTLASATVVPCAGAAENAGHAPKIKATRRIALKRDMNKAAGGSVTPGEEAPRDAALAPGLYVVATPIGNLGDITHRALDALRRADVVAAEDTRNTRGLLAHFGIGTRLVAVHEHNERGAAERVCAWIGEGKSVALVSDAGTPGVSDPGSTVVEAVRAAGHPVVPIPGASALTTALSASGLHFDGVVFAGFLPARGGERRERLAALAAGPWAIALFEAPHRVVETVQDLHEALGDRDIVIARELTKRFESIVRMPLRDARSWLEADDDRRRGEFVLLVEGRAVEAALAADPRAVLEALLAELPLKQAVALATKITGGKRNELYALALELKKL
jgi:16S rRNA (cytidine1402-2'-O)-methyltransferase